MLFHDRRNGVVTNTAPSRGAGRVKPQVRRDGRKRPPPTSDESMEAMSQSCPDCNARPFQPCHGDCSSHWGYS